jgi:hypothetical protein
MVYHLWRRNISLEKSEQNQFFTYKNLSDDLE